MKLLLIHNSITVTVNLSYLYLQYNNSILITDRLPETSESEGLFIVLDGKFQKIVRHFQSIDQRTTILNLSRD